MCPFWLNSRLIRILGRPRPRVGIADGHRADALRGGDVALEQERRRSQRGGDVVEAEVGPVARQPVRDVDVEREQIANRVRILAAVQAMHHVAARRAAALPGTIERSGEPGREADVLAFGRVRHALRRHGARAQLAEHAFPGVGLRQQIVETGRLEVHRRIGWRRRAAVVTADAVLVQPGAMLRRLGRRATVTRGPAGCAPTAPRRARHRPGRARAASRLRQHHGGAEKTSTALVRGFSTCGASPAPRRSTFFSIFFSPSSRPSVFFRRSFLVSLLDRVVGRLVFVLRVVVFLVVLLGDRRRHGRGIVGSEMHQARAAPRSPPHACPAWA